MLLRKVGRVAPDLTQLIGIYLVTKIAKITGEEWKNITEKQKAPYEKIALKNKEKYMQEMDMYKQKIEEESANLKKEEEELMKLQKQEAMKLLKKKEKTETLIKIMTNLYIFFCLTMSEAAKKKKKKSKSKKKKEPLQRTDPPSIPVVEVFASG
ncbi:high mobility group b protein 6 [Phtheirospermum japonicum]|uniref:High mobility group b protein 6 n=1 Tax=Phtheirospermum japonicum TaxID=374723 RepID=A0A830BXP7_9LAMI|nr:high mobility group b protein 6 [Phtheirospermum japonicum]